MYYVDKTAYVERLLREGTHYLLSRPRRFGKSLFLARQLRERDYAAKYRGRGERNHLIGVEFSRKTRNVTAFEVADG